jgi:hypothetical protein
MFSYSVDDGMYICKSTDVKRTDVDEHTKCLEWDTGNLYIFEEGAWHLM